MFCRQCEQAKKGFGCTTLGTCGKNSDTSAVQDALMHLVKSVSTHCVTAREAGGARREEMRAADNWTLEATFSTLTNVNFSEDDIVDFIKAGVGIKEDLKVFLLSKGCELPFDKCSSLDASMSFEDFEEFGRKEANLLKREMAMGDENAFSLNEIATAGTKGVAAYATHCARLDFFDEEKIIKPLQQVWSKLESDEPDVDALLQTVLQVGDISLATLSMLDEAHATTYGSPEPTKVRFSTMKGKAILVSGHDLKDLYQLLQQTEGTGINVYTHGEMLPAHSYPEIKRFPHLVGNYGTAWQKQKIEFANFPGPILVTSNCILHPRRTYRDRIYTTNQVGVYGVKHIDEGKDFSQLLQNAQDMDGFEIDEPNPHYKTAGFSHRHLVPMVKDIIKAVQDGHLSRVFLIGGCDGTEHKRNYFTDLAESAPDDSIILTLGCAKNRVIHSQKLLDAKLANGLPRVMDMGQCNDSYSAIVLVQALAKELNCGVNDLPVSLALSHLEQKAAAVLLALLNLGVKNIRLGPTLPAYISPGILSVLQQNYNLMGTGSPKEDLEAMMKGN
eukprot:CAMPEP_0172497468 /NCGR_PEP_ID=MMETSP1066-20121228/100399_1 /TAXON_ID=671091 /ORGANISM="Coscinodiscus wailesii, Strain CCMP2513" /LENGTH=557 /DNA_ID=CAMNT_0013270267 /DNA_START=308 /DNA_END=1981 /DNA_ORIENTATION=+